MGQQIKITDQPLEGFQLLTDRDLYISGETIWFAVHEVKKQDLQNPAISKIIYVELISTDKKVISKGKFNLTKGTAKGQLTIPGEQSSGVFIIRAYTQYLKNFHTSTYPEKIINIVNPSVPLSKRPEPETSNLIIVPKDGRLISGLNNEIAFRVIDPAKRKINRISLYLQDSLTTTEIDFYNNGLGKFKFIPAVGNKYFLQVHFLNGDSLVQAINNVAESGITTSIKEKKDEVVYGINKSSQSPFAHNKRYFLKVSDGLLSEIFNDSLSGVSPFIEFRINKRNLRPGINYFLLKNEKDEVLDFTIYYNNSAEIISVDVKTDQSSYKPGNKVNLDLRLNNIQNDEIANLSVSVVKKGTIQKIKETLPLWLIEHPLLIKPDLFESYKPSEELHHQVQIALDLYAPKVLTLNDIEIEINNSQKNLQYLPEIRSASISGYVKNTTDNTGIEGTKVLLSYVGQQAQIHVNETQEDGYFIFSLEKYDSNQDLFLCTFDENPGQKILINSDFSNNYPKLNKIYPDIDTTDQRLLEELFINHQLEAMNQKNDPELFSSENTYKLGFGTPDISIRLEDYIDLPSMEVVLNEIVPYVKVRKRKGNYRLTILDSETGLTYENHLILVDNIPLDNVNELMQIRPAMVEQVDVINRTYVIGDFTFQGILMVKTYTENFGGITLPMDAVFIKYPLAAETPFEYTYVPDETSNKMIHTDHRNVLLWEPTVLVKGSSTLSFYTSDHLSSYQIQVNGVSSDGRLVYGQTEIEVK